MPTAEEIIVLTGDDKVEDSTSENSDTQKDVVDRSEYEKLAASYENHRTLENRRDKELSELREKVKRYESKENTVVETEDEDDDLNDLRLKLEKIGAIPRTQDDMREEIKKTILQEQFVKDMTVKVADTIKKHPFVKESELISFLNRNPDFAYERALKALYPDEMRSVEAGEGAADTVAETDKGGRTLSVRAQQSAPNENSPKRGIPRGISFSDMIANTISKNVDKNAGIR